CCGVGRGYNAVAWTKKVRNDRPRDKREGGNYFEIQDRFPSNASNLLQAFHTADTKRYGEEDDRIDEDFHHVDESRAEWPHGHPGIREEVSDQCTRRDCR